MAASGAKQCYGTLIYYYKSFIAIAAMALVQVRLEYAKSHISSEMPPTWMWAWSAFPDSQYGAFAAKEAVKLGWCRKQFHYDEEIDFEASAEFDGSCCFLAGVVASP